VRTATLRASTALAVATTAGVSTLFVGAAPAFAASEACGPSDGALVAPGVCELTFTSGTSTFTPTADMTKLEALLVGAGGSSAVSTATGYAAAGGGGGEVKIVDLSGETSALTITVPTPGTTGGVAHGASNDTVANGGDGTIDLVGGAITGGASGNGNAGATTTVGSGAQYAGGGGASASPVSQPDGGSGIVVGAIASSGSLFAGDARCFGGGGAVVFASAAGIANCGGGVGGAPTANTGGGGGANDDTSSYFAGASGVVILRWTAADVALGFDMGGHGTAPATQAITAGGIPTAPADPTVPGYVFGGWYTDSSLATPADFSVPLTESTTFFAKWTITQVTVSFDVGAHGTAPAAQTVDYGTPVLEPADPSEAGQVFGGWFTDASLTAPADFSAPVTASGTLYAKWSAAQLVVTFDVGAHGTAPAPRTVDYGTPVSAPAEPSAVGYLFAGWFSDEELTIPADFSDPITEPVTLYAKWAAAPAVADADDLPSTGADVRGALLAAAAALLAGAGLAGVAVARRRRSA
jgi:uncharacterized repeat protein (TIGR02543 family)